MGVNPKEFERAKEQVEKQSAQIKELVAQKNALQARVDELSDEVLPVQEAETLLEKLRQQKEELVEQIGTLEIAKQIADTRDSVVAQAREHAAEIVATAQKELELLNARIESEKSRLAEITGLVGIYEQADRILAVVNANAKAVERKAAEEAGQVLADSQRKSNEIIAAAEAILQENTERAQQRIAEAEESAQNIMNQANADAKCSRENKRVEGEAIKKQIVARAEQERNNILAQAQADAQSISDGIVNGANVYDDNTRQAADRYAEETRAKADTYKQKVLEDAVRTQTVAEAQRERTVRAAQTEAAQILDEGRKQREAERVQLAAQAQKLAQEQEEIKMEQERLASERLALEHRSKRLDEEVEELVKERNSENITARDSARQTVYALQAANRELEEKLNKMRIGKLSERQGEQFAQLLEKMKTAGMSFDADIAGLIEAQQRYEKVQKQCDELRVKIDNLSEENAKLQANRSSDVGLRAELDMAHLQKEHYEQISKELLAELDKRKVVTREGMLAKVKEAPAFLRDGKWMQHDDEIAWLNHIKASAEQSDLYFSERQLYAYHTAQKIRDISSLVVLAGVSGTGKSELPKNYALHGGMQFLSVPVKPDWDSPASLFGYYNSIERIFEASDLLRAVWQMANSRKEQMFMVLLDEMNLAHPEQYFADLLSKLETCRGTGISAAYDILLGGGEHSEPVAIGGNVLWTGTMNEDETTKGLSDKVIDRSTLITFPRPKTLRSRKNTIEVQPSGELLHVKTWNEWVNSYKHGNSDDPVEKILNGYKETVEHINHSMSLMSRNLGHRVWQGMEAYIRNYPTVISAKKDDELKKEMDVAFADAIAFKIMPKLRGVEVRGQNEQHLDAIGALLKQHADTLSVDYDNARSMATELFQWNSAEFMSDEGKK